MGAQYYPLFGILAALDFDHNVPDGLDFIGDVELEVDLRWPGANVIRERESSLPVGRRFRASDRFQQARCRE
jgi:hypothetical protein